MALDELARTAPDDQRDCLTDARQKIDTPPQHRHAAIPGAVGRRELVEIVAANFHAMEAATSRTFRGDGIHFEAVISRRSSLLNIPLPQPAETGGQENRVEGAQRGASARIGERLPSLDRHVGV